MHSPPSQETTQSRIRRAPAWSEREVLDLTACWGDESVMAELRSKKRNANTYAKVSRAMMERGYSRDTDQCRTKIKALRQAYQKAREVNGHSGSQPHKCRFYCELHAIMGGDDITTPLLSVDTCKGGVARSEEDEFLEDEEEDSAQAASGESVFPPSQELFLTLEPLASPYSQSMLPDHDPGEGTSERGVALKLTLLGRIWGSADANQHYWPPEAIPECSNVTALDSTFNSDALARMFYTVMPAENTEPVAQPQTVTRASEPYVPVSPTSDLNATEQEDVDTATSENADSVMMTESLFREM
ncbi:Zinc finger and SCAN domain-containing protein 29 [Chelonia mydas]|uniref:Zinc finger and SCAN domain-containing protein 29 n=1 Tax=Chelonia mydas TaxID=8469 RepID=M7APY4_CHEMY|nr:Zinc finger and SCAN domain-containing protein 29 [Chelonia mydas]